VVLAGRDRSAAGVLKRKRAKERELEEDSEEDPLKGFQTPKVRSSDVFWTFLALTGSRRAVTTPSASPRPPVRSVIARRPKLPFSRPVVPRRRPALPVVGLIPAVAFLPLPAGPVAMLRALLAPSGATHPFGIHYNT
jgi:hypothetical protein